VTALLQVKDLKKHFRARHGQRGRDTVRAVDGVSFQLERGESLGLVGESGCGKSTTARTILGLHPASSGSVRFDGQELTGLSRRGWAPYRRRMQMIFQDPYASLDPRQTVGSILAEPLKIHGLFKPRERMLRALALLDAVGLNPRHVNRYPHEFSGGQRQRIGIARALALEPELIVCDEPVSALDVSIQAQILNLLMDLQERFGLAYLFIAHDLAVVRRLCERVAVMYLGRIVEIAERDLLFDHPKHPYTQALLSAVPVADPRVEATRERIVLAGDVPSPSNPPPGCAFHPRCREKSKVPNNRCETDVPQLPTAAMQARATACHLITDVVPVEAVKSAPAPSPSAPTRRDAFYSRQGPGEAMPLPPKPEQPPVPEPLPPLPQEEAHEEEPASEEARSAKKTATKSGREMNEAERAIFEMIRAGYGEQNKADLVHINDHDDAVVYVIDGNDRSVLTANLTTLARWRSDGTIGSDDELRTDWLRIED
jgi:oligopeptide transport system ATP-binding protein